MPEAVAARLQHDRPGRIVALLMIPVLLYLLVQAVFSGMAYVAQYRLHATIDRWQAASVTVPLAQWQVMESFALQALSHDQGNPDLLNAVGRLYDYRAGRLAQDVNNAREWRIRAAGYYRQVPRLRPAWPYGWLNLAMIKAASGEPDREFRSALSHLLSLGSWEANTLPALVQLALYGWPYMGRSERAPFLDYFRRAQQSRADDVRAALCRGRQLSLYCAIVAHAGAPASFCP